MQESHKRTTPVLDFQRQSPEHQLPPRFARLVTNGASRMVLQASDQFTLVNHPVGQMELGEEIRYSWKGLEHRVETRRQASRKSGRRLHDPLG